MKNINDNKRLFTLESDANGIIVEHKSRETAMTLLAVIVKESSIDFDREMSDYRVINEANGEVFASYHG